MTNDSRTPTLRSSRLLDAWPEILPPGDVVDRILAARAAGAPDHQSLHATILRIETIADRQWRRGSTALPFTREAPRAFTSMQIFVAKVSGRLRVASRCCHGHVPAT
jgi:hypothetical protein